MNIDWKSITPDNIDDLRPISWAYCQALVNLKLWDKFCEAFYDDSLTELIVGALLKSNVRKSLLKKMEEAKIIHLLDTVNPLIRRHLLNILIEQADQCPVSIAVGESLLKDISHHPWGYEFTKEIFSLQSYETLKIAFKARIKQSHAKSPLMFWQYATDPTNSYIVKAERAIKENTNDNTNSVHFHIHKPRFVYLTKEYFANARQLKKRTNFASFVTDLYIEGIETLKKNAEYIEDSEYFNFIYKPLYNIFVGFEDVWIQNVDTYTKVRDALLSFPFHLTKFTPITSFMLNLSMSNEYFDFNYFIKHKIINNDDIIFNILPAALEEDFKKPLLETKFVYRFIGVFNRSCSTRLYNFYKSLQAISVSSTLKEDKSNNYQKLAFIWPKLLQYYEEYAQHCFEQENSQPLLYLIKYINVDNVRNLTGISDTFQFTFDYAIGIINKIIHDTLDNKEKITNYSPASYQRKISLIFSSMIYPYTWRNTINISNQIQNTPFYKFLDAETRDKILIDFITDPNGKSISNEINNDSPTTLFALCLIFDDLKKITQILDRNKDDKSDEYGFVQNISFNFPASLTQKSRKVEEYKGTIHVFEKKIIPLLRHKIESIANNAYNLYLYFVEKLFYLAIKLNEKSLYSLACESHFRLCRFLNANTTPENQSYVIRKFIERVCNPLSLYVGIKAHETESSNGCEEYAASLYDNIIVKFPFITEQLGLTMFPIIVQILIASKHKSLPGIGVVGAIIVDKLMNRLFNEIPATFKIPSNYYSNLQGNFNFYTYFNQLEENDKLFNENTIKEFQKLQNERAQMVFPDLLVKRFLKNVIKKQSKLDISPRTLNMFISPSLINNNLFTKKDSTRIKPAFEPFMKLIEILNEKVDSYNSENYDHPTTHLIKQFTSFISSANLCHKTIQIYHDLPQIVIDQFDSIRSQDSNTISETEASFNQKLQNFEIKYELSKDTIEFIKSIFKDDTDQDFMLELINSESFDYDVLAKIINFVPLTKQQEIERKKNEVEYKPPELRFNIDVKYKRNEAFIYYLQVKNSKQPEKQKKCQLCGRVLPEKPTKKNQRKGPALPEYGSWENIVSWDIAKPILSLNPETFCKALKTNGNDLFNYIKILYRQLTKNNIDINMESKTIKLINNGEKSGQFKSIDFNFVAHLLNLCFRDILTEDPEPTKENPNPKPTPTLFSDDKGNISTLLSPFADNNSRNNAASAGSVPQLQGDRKFFSTKVLIAYLTSILSLPMSVGHVDLSIFASSLNEVLSMPPADLKKVIGNDNYSYYIDHLVSMFITHLSFGKDIKNKEWAAKFESPLFECFFRLFTCDATHHVTLEFVNKKLQSLANVDAKNAIVSSLVSILSNTDLNFTLHTRTRTAAWCVDQRYVGSPLPSYCVEYLDLLASDEKCHIDIKKTIAAGIVAIFKSQSIVRANPTSQFKELFDILTKLYSKSKQLMTPFFCQLLRPEFCFSLAKSSNAYASLMPTKSLPEALLTSLPFGVISMPQDERFENDTTEANDDTPKSWKEAYDLYLSSFIGSSLLLKEENILQLVIQVLTNVQARGGKTAEMISKFINSLLSGPNILKLSPILINFIFSFCLQDPHKELDKLVDSFVSIFAKLRESVDEINQKQCTNFWTNSYSFKESNYDSVKSTCSSFTNSFEYVIENLRNKADIRNAHEISKRIVAAMDGKDHPSLFVSSFVALRNLFSFIADDDFIKPLLSLYATPEGEKEEENNEEENLLCLLKFVRNTALLIHNTTSYPSFVQKAFKKNISGLNNNVMKEICQWPVEVCQNSNVISVVMPLIQSFKKEILKPAADSDKITEELKEIMSKLWVFSKLGEYGSSAYSDPDFYLSYNYGSGLNQNLIYCSEAEILNALKEKKKKPKKPVGRVQRRGRAGRRVQRRGGY